jgi:hypothetical protein
MTHETAPESTESDAGPESGPVSDRDAQDAREARYAEAIGLANNAETRAAATSRVMALSDAELAPLRARVAELEAEVERLKRGGAELGRILDRTLRDALDASGRHDVIGDDGDGDWEVVWETLAELRPRAERAEAALARVEALPDSVITKFADYLHWHERGYWRIVNDSGYVSVPMDREVAQRDAPGFGGTTLYRAEPWPKPVWADHLRAALAAAGPAVSVAAPCRCGHAKAEHPAPDGDTYCLRCSCAHYLPTVADMMRDTEAVGRLLADVDSTVVSDGEGATSEAHGPWWDADHDREADVYCPPERAYCKRCGIGRRFADALTCKEPTGAPRLRPASLVVAPSATDEGGA